MSIDHSDTGVEVSSNRQTGELEINWEFWRTQLETLNALDSGEYDLVVFRAGYGSGKSVLGARAIIRSALAVPKSDNLILAQDKKKGGPATFKKFFEELPGEDTVPEEAGDPENSPIVENFHGTDLRVTLINGAIIRLGSADKWNRYAGSEFNFIWCDEVAHYDNTSVHKLNEMLISRQRTEAGPNVSLWTSTGNGYNDFWEFVELREDRDENPINIDMAVFVADSRDNPYLNEKEKLKRQFEGSEREQEGLAGGFAAAEGLVYDRFTRNRHVRDPDWCREQTADAWRIYGYDHGFKDPRVVPEIGRTSRGQFVVLGLFYRERSDPEDVIDPDDGTGWLAPRPLGTIYSEHEPGHMSKFERAGWETEKAIKDLDDGIEHVRSLLQVDPELGEPGLLVSDDCDELIREFQTYQEDDVGTSGADDHALDAVRYALYTHEYGGSSGKETRRDTRGARSSRSARNQGGGSNGRNRTRGSRSRSNRSRRR